MNMLVAMAHLDDSFHITTHKKHSLRHGNCAANLHSFLCVRMRDALSIVIQERQEHLRLCIGESTHLCLDIALVVSHFPPEGKGSFIHTHAMVPCRLTTRSKLYSSPFIILHMRNSLSITDIGVCGAMDTVAE